MKEWPQISADYQRNIFCILRIGRVLGSLLVIGE